MLAELRIENFAIIEKLELHFNSGLIIFTGETGAGKSILIDAIETLLGGRIDASQIRSGAERAYIEALFIIPKNQRAEIHQLLSGEDLLDNPDCLTLARELRPAGRSTARVNGRSVTVAYLRSIGEKLVDIHGQSEHLSLLQTSHHLSLLDSFASVDVLLQAYQKTYHQLVSVRRELSELQKAESESARRLDMLGFQINEIETAHLKTGEEQLLIAERNRLANSESLASLVQQALIALDDGDPESPAASDLLGQVVHHLRELARLDPTLDSITEQAHTLSDEVNDLSRSLRSYQENIEFNPRRLDQVEERLSLMHTLKKKYGESIEAVLHFAQEARRQRENITNAAERIEELESEETSLLSTLKEQGVVLSDKRHQEAERLAKLIENELETLHMENTLFSTDFQHRPDPEGIPLENQTRVAFDINGFEKTEFLIAPNPGEGLKPLAKIASGGETSRLMLALKNVLASADQIPSLIFDEIDQGIGGRVGAIVGQKLSNLARQHQVFCVTHLPQLAAYGNQHYHVHKETTGERTITKVKLLDKELRVVELAQMLGSNSQANMQSARELLTQANTIINTR